MRLVANGTITTVAGNGTVGYTGDNGAATSAELQNPVGVALDSSGNLYIADAENSVVRMVTISTGKITTFAGDNSLGAGYSGDGLAATGCPTKRSGGRSRGFVRQCLHRRCGQ